MPLIQQLKRYERKRSGQRSLKAVLRDIEERRAVVPPAEESIDLMTSLLTLYRPALAVFTAIVLSACSTTNAETIQSGKERPPITTKSANKPSDRPVQGSASSMYGPVTDTGFQVPGVDAGKMNPKHVRQLVDYSSNEAPGTIVVDQGARFLYLVQPGGKALRYAVGVGPDARAFGGGDAVIARKAAWPRWRPTDSMIERNPGHYGKYSDGVAGGPSNPLGARALYMHKDGIDTYYRVHGTNDPSSIGKAVSAGCIRLLNQDVIDLYERVKPGARIVVK